MKMNDIIRQKRLEKGLTQEQVAHYLGVTTPAVNKWEKGSTYPDIILLPALARLLDTDLNTLLSFKENLSNKEIALFMNEITKIVESDGFEKGYSLAMKKIKEFPNCDALIGNIAILLGGFVNLSGKKVAKKYEEEIENLHKLAAKSKDVNIKEQSQGILISKLIEKKEFEKAQEMLDTFSKESWVDRKQLQANLYIAKEEYAKAARLTEEKLLSATSDIHSCLMTLMEIAIKEERISDAEYIANVDRDAVKLFDLWEYNSYVAHSQLYDATKNRIKARKIFLLMLKSLTKKWEIEKSPLYRHIQKKEPEKEIGSKFQKYIIQAINNDEKMNYLMEDSEIQKVIKELDAE